MHVRLLILRVLVLLAMAVCLAQLVDHISEAGAFCGPGGSCEEITSSSIGNPFGIPLSALGLAAFLVLYLFTFIPRLWAAKATRLAAILAGTVGAGLIVVQLAVFQKICPLCTIVDGSSIGIACLAAVGLPQPVAPSRFGLLGWTALTLVTLLIPVFWTAAVMPEVAPPEVQAHWVPGEITVVEVSDFECSHCKKADVAVRAFLPNHKVHFVRIVAAMPTHKNAPNAARAFVAARLQGKGEEMAAELFASDLLTPEKCRELAVKLDLNLPEYDKFVTQSNSDTEHRETNAWTTRIRIGVPQIWIQNELVTSPVTVERLEAAYRKARPPAK